MSTQRNRNTLERVHRDAQVAAAEYRAAAKRAHPDVGGDAAVMSKVNRAKDFIEKHR